MKLLFIALGFYLLPLPAHGANYLWSGGEDHDFPNGAMVCAQGTAGYFRAGYSRYSVRTCTNGAIPKSSVFRGGGVTSVWLSARHLGGTSTGGHKIIGLGKSGTNSGLYIGIHTGVGYKIALYKLDNGTFTMLTSETGVSSTNYMLTKFDMQIVNYGVAGTVRIYMSGQPTLNSSNPILTYTGDISIAGVSDLDSVFLSPSDTSYASEIIVSDSDTRNLSLVTLTPNADGDLNQWTGGNYVNISGTTQNDAGPISSNTDGDKFQCNVSNLPSIGLSVLNVKVGSRSTMTAGGMTSVQLGVKTNSTLSTPAASTTLTGAWGLVETYYDQNPVTALPWVNSDVDALQLNLTTRP